MNVSKKHFYQMMLLPLFMLLALFSFQKDASAISEQQVNNAYQMGFFKEYKSESIIKGFIDKSLNAHTVGYKGIRDYDGYYMALQGNYINSRGTGSENIITFEVYQKGGGNRLQLIEMAKYNMEGKTLEDLKFYLSRDIYNYDEYLYFVAGIAKNLWDEDYLTSEYFKIKNPFYQQGVVDSGGYPNPVNGLEPRTPNAPTVNPINARDTHITGQSDPGTIVYVVTEGNLIAEAAMGYNRNFNIAIPELEAGMEIEVFASSVGMFSKKTKLNVGGSSAVAKPKVDPVHNYSSYITGTAQAGTIVAVFNEYDEEEIGWDYTEDDGSFFIEIDYYQEAGWKLEVYAFDEDENISEPAIVTVRDATPTVKGKISDKSKSITGKALPGLYVVFETEKGELGAAITDKSGNYNFKLKKPLKAGTVVWIYTTDDETFDSAPIQTKVIDKTPPKVPTVNKVTSKSKTVKGKAEAGATVYVIKSGKVIGKAKANKSGNYTVKIKKQKQGSTLYVYAKDKAGNESKSKKVSVKKK